jgi:prolyl oligopeptidase
VRTALAETSPADYSDCEVVRDEAISQDGTRVPITVLRRRGIALDGRHPTIVYGYGGYGVCQTPGFRGRLRAWIERGGVFAVAHIRGGGEFGEKWHREGSLELKQNVFDDFAACARRMISVGYATHAKLALMGGSNGGLLMGAMITQHPDLARAVVSLVGLYDMLRVELTPNGAYNVPEFGTVTEPEMFRVLHAYSPYHRVKDGLAYPSILMATPSAGLFLRQRPSIKIACGSSGVRSSTARNVSAAAISTLLPAFLYW